jgi:preprotein translocase subunit SecE
MATTAEKSTNPVSRLRTYTGEVKTEMEKVTWPTREDLKAHTTVVLFFLGLLAVVVGIMDVVFQRVILTIFENV